MKKEKKKSPTVSALAKKLQELIDEGKGDMTVRCVRIHDTQDEVFASENYDMYAINGVGSGEIVARDEKIALIRIELLNY